MANKRALQNPTIAKLPKADAVANAPAYAEKTRQRIRVDAQSFGKRVNEIEDALRKFSSDSFAAKDRLVEITRRAPGAIRFIVNAAELPDGMLENMAREVALEPKIVENVRKLRSLALSNKSRLEWIEELGERKTGSKGETSARAKRMVALVAPGSSLNLRLAWIVARMMGGDKVVAVLRAFCNESPEHEMILRALAAGEKQAAAESSAWGLTAHERSMFIRWWRQHAVLEDPAHEALAMARGVSFTWSSVAHRATMRLEDGYPLVDFTVFSKGRSVVSGIAEFDDLLRLIRSLLGALASVAIGLAPNADRFDYKFVAESLKAIDEVKVSQDKIKALLLEWASHFPGLGNITAEG